MLDHRRARRLFQPLQTIAAHNAVSQRRPGWRRALKRLTSPRARQSGDHAGGADPGVFLPGLGTRITLAGLRLAAQVTNERTNHPISIDPVRSAAAHAGSPAELAGSRTWL